MRVNNPDFAGDTLSPEGFIDWLVGLRDVPAVTESETGRALAFEKLNRRVVSSSSPAIIGASGSGNVASHFAPSQAKAGLCAWCIRLVRLAHNGAFLYAGAKGLITDGGPSIEERADLFLEAQDRVKKMASVKHP
ncbi:hypothetical protein Tco_0897605 [Tanacetum coccineum]